MTECNGFRVSWVLLVAFLLGLMGQLVAANTCVVTVLLAVICFGL